MNIETKCVQAGYTPANGQARVLPIYQSTTFQYDSTEHVAKLFDLEEDGFFYSRINNPTVDCVEKKIAALEGGVAALCLSSGQAAVFMAIFNIAGAGSHIISSTNVYGGTFNLFSVTLKKMGIEVTFVDPKGSIEDIEREIRKNTKAIYGESIANPSMSVLDIEKFAQAAHRNGLPLIVDNTFATPINLKPFEYGADIVVHSTSKYMDGHAVVLGGAIVDSGRFIFEGEKFEEFTTPDDSYHGVVYNRDFPVSPYIVKARVQMLRDLGCTMAPNSAFLLNLGLETLHLRVKKHCENALILAKHLKNSSKVSFVKYPSLEGDEYFSLAQKYLPCGSCGVLSFEMKGGYEAAVRFMDSVKVAKIVVHVADARTCVLHPASSTHRQLSAEQLKLTGITPGLIRLSVGIEGVEDLMEDIDQAMKKV